MSSEQHSSSIPLLMVDLLCHFPCSLGWWCHADSHFSSHFPDFWCHTHSLLLFPCYWLMMSRTIVVSLPMLSINDVIGIRGSHVPPITRTPGSSQLMMSCTLMTPLPVFLIDDVIRAHGSLWICGCRGGPDTPPLGTWGVCHCAMAMVWDDPWASPNLFCEGGSGPAWPAGLCN